MSNNKIVDIVLTVLCIIVTVIAVTFLLSDVKSKKTSAAASWRKAYFITPDYIPCLPPGQDCVVVKPN